MFSFRADSIASWEKNSKKKQSKGAESVHLKTRREHTGRVRRTHYQKPHNSKFQESMWKLFKGTRWLHKVGHQGMTQTEQLNKQDLEPKSVSGGKTNKREQGNRQTRGNLSVGRLRAWLRGWCCEQQKQDETRQGDVQNPTDKPCRQGQARTCTGTNWLIDNGVLNTLKLLPLVAKVEGMGLILSTRALLTPPRERRR